MKIEKRRNRVIDIARGISIASIVIGHALNTTNFESHLADIVRQFVYTYHLMFFFWVMGYFYKEKTIKKFVAQFTRKMYLKYVMIASLSFVLLPVWYVLRVLPVYSLKELVYQLAYIGCFQVTRGILMGPLWFITWSGVAQIIYFTTNKILTVLSREGRWSARRANLSRAIVFCIFGGAEYFFA